MTVAIGRGAPGGDMKDRLSQRRSDEGFTLFELLIVIVILAILAGIVVFSVGSSNANAATSACQSDAKTLENALEEYKSAVGVYPGDPTLQTSASNPPATGNGNTWAHMLTTPSPVYGVLGNVTAANPSGNWTAPNGVSVGALMRELPSTQEYQIVTDGQGGVYVYPPAPAHIPGAAAMATTDAGLEVFGNPAQDTESMNFQTNPAICADTNVVK